MLLKRCMEGEGLVCSGPIHSLSTGRADLGQTLAVVREQGKSVHAVIQAAVDTQGCASTLVSKGGN